MRRRCKNKCTHYGELVELYQDGPPSPLGVISLRCPECGLYDFIFPDKEVIEALGKEHRLPRKVDN